MDDLKTILLQVSLLKSLDICLEKGKLTCDFTVTSTQFTRLHLTIDNTLISMDVMEQFLSKLICLKHLVLETHVTDDIFNVQKWENLTNNLVKFNFKFYMINCSNRNLDSFRTSFWLKEKHWFIASNSNSIFSIPHFCPSEIFFPGSFFIDSTAPNDQLLFIDQSTNNTKTNERNSRLSI